MAATAALGGIGHPLAWMDHGHGMTSRRQAVDQMGQGERHPIDFRRIGFSDDTKVSWIAYTLVGPDPGGGRH